ncbi:hypothetical protein MRX96_007419 [Rhipicephalus microplus]
MKNKFAMVILALQQPPPLDFEKRQCGPAWIDHFDDYRFTTALNERSGEARTRTLLYTMGRQAREVFSTFVLTEDEARNYDVVEQKFGNDFIKEHKIVCESAWLSQKSATAGKIGKPVRDGTSCSCGPLRFWGYEENAYPGQVRRRSSWRATVRGLTDGSAADIGISADQGSSQGNHATAATVSPAGRCSLR